MIKMTCKDCIYREENICTLDDSQIDDPANTPICGWFESISEIRLKEIVRSSGKIYYVRLILPKKIEITKVTTRKKDHKMCAVQFIYKFGTNNYLDTPVDVKELSAEEMSNTIGLENLMTRDQYRELLDDINAKMYMDIDKKCDKEKTQIAYRISAFKDF